MKLFGALLIIIASTLIGFYRASQYAQRPKQIRLFIHSLHRLVTEIDYGGTPLPIALRKLAVQSREPVSGILQLAADRLQGEQAVSVQEAWHEAVQTKWGHTAMKAAEKEALLELGASLGVSDRQDQLKHLQLSISQLQHEEAASRDEQAQYEKLCRSLGLLSGALLVILIY